jgi:hypothetical protein
VLDEVKIIKSINSKSFPKPFHTETPSQVLSGQPNIVWIYPRCPHPPQRDPSRTLSGSPRTLFEFWILAQQLVFWESSIYTPPPPMALSSWLSKFPVERVHPLHSKSLNSHSPRAFIPSSWLGFEWSKDSSPCVIHHNYWIFILHTSYSWSVAPRRLEVAREPPLGVVSLEKFVLPFFVIVSSSRVSWWLLERGKGWERPSFLWAPQWGRRIHCESKP